LSYDVLEQLYSLFLYRRLFEFRFNREIVSVTDIYNKSLEKFTALHVLETNCGDGGLEYPHSAAELGEDHKNLPSVSSLAANARQ
jgi:hypothetical protein